MSRKIIHLDLDAFFCAVEAQNNPGLRGKPFAVGGRPEKRGVVASCSYEARRFGIRSAMPMSQAVRLCPDLIIVSQHHRDYSKASRKVMAHLNNLTPLVEQLSIDEAFLDVTILRDEAQVIAHHLQSTINDDPGLPCSLGVATNKLVAKVANTIGKAEASQRKEGTPNAIKIVAPGDEEAFLAPLPVSALWGVGPRTEARLTTLGIHTVGDLAKQPEEEIVRRFGKHGYSLIRQARGIDDREVVTSHETRSISREVTFDRDISDATTLKRVLRRLSEDVGRQTRRSELTGTTIKIKLRWSDFTTLSRQVTLPNPTDQDAEIQNAALSLFLQNWPEGRPVRLLGVGISGFEAPHRQLGLWEDSAALADNRRLQSALDELRDRYGDDTIKRGSDLRKRK